VFGTGSLAEAGFAAARLGGRRPFVVTDPGILEAGWVDELTGLLRDAGLTPCVWRGVTPSPKDHEIADGYNRYRMSGCDVIVAIGGGSVGQGDDHRPAAVAGHLDVGDPQRSQRIRGQGRRHVGTGPGDPGGGARRERFRPRSAAAMVKAMNIPGPAAATRLTDREREVLNLLARGLSNRAIGKRLFISETTAKFHVGNIMRKLDVSRRAEAVYEASKLGMI
jgi:DNA-binding CsgD family transcriptional regulator